MGDLLGFKMVMSSPIFQMLGIMLCSIEWLNMSVRALMATGSGDPPDPGVVCWGFVLR